MGVVVVGVTGATRCGKGRVSTALSAILGGAEVVKQDKFWFRRWRSPTGEPSEEEPECTDFAKFVQKIQKAKEAAAFSGRRFVIAEGFSMLHDASVRALLGPIHMLEISREECIRRRSAPKGPLNPRPINAGRVATVVWPAHERHCSASIDPLGNRVQRHAEPSTEAEMAAIVSQILAPLLAE